jgi:hypothetical protein
MARQNTWENRVVEHVNLLHDSTDALESELLAITAMYVSLEKEFRDLSNSYRELKLKIK